MPHNIVDLDPKQRSIPPNPAATDFWFAQLDVRLSRITLLVTRLEWHMLLIACWCGALLVIDLIQLLRSF